MIEVLKPANLPDGLQSIWPLLPPDDLRDQESHERQLLLSDTQRDWNALVDAHMLPW